MKTPAFSAARRLASVDKPDSSLGDGQSRENLPVQPAPRPAAGEGRGAPAVAFGGIRPPRRQVPASPAPDLSSELEAALLSDLESMVSLFDDAARDDSKPAPRRDGDMAAETETLERLIADMRARGRAAGTTAVEGATTADAGSKDADPAGSMPRRPASPRPAARDGRRAPSPASRPRQPANHNEVEKVRAEPVPALKIDLPRARRSFLKPAIAISALILVAAIGAGMTVRSLTARSDAAGERTAASSLAAPAETSGPAQSTAPVATEGTISTAASDSPGASATPTPTAVAAAAPVVRSVDPLPAQSEGAGAVRAAVDSRSGTVAPIVDSKPPIEIRVPAATPATAPADDTAAAPAAAPAVARAETPAAAPVEPSPAPAAEAAAPAAAASAPVAVAKAVPAAGRGLPAGPAKVASGVNLRSNPDKGAPVVGQLKTGESVEVVSCNFWCEVVAGDKRGYVFQKFLEPVTGGQG